MKPRPTCTLKSPQIRHHDHTKNVSPNNFAEISADLLLVGQKLYGIPKPGLNVFDIKNMLLFSSKKT